MAGGSIDVDPDELDQASSAVAGVIDEHEGVEFALGAADYGHDGLKTAADTFGTQTRLAVDQLTTTLDVLAVELTTQAEAYRAADARSDDTFTGLGSSLVPTPSPSPGPAPSAPGTD